MCGHSCAPCAWRISVQERRLVGDCFGYSMQRGSRRLVDERANPWRDRTHEATARLVSSAHRSHPVRQVPMTPDLIGCLTPGAMKAHPAELGPAPAGFIDFFQASTTGSYPSGAVSTGDPCPPFRIGRLGTRTGCSLLARSVPPGSSSLGSTPAEAIRRVVSRCKRAHHPFVNKEGECGDGSIDNQPEHGRS